MPRLRTSIRRTLTAALVATATLATPATAAPAQGQAVTPTSRINWSSCSDTEFEGMQCGTLRVPVDYAHPRAGSLTLALVRRPPTTGTTARAHFCSTTEPADHQSNNSASRGGSASRPSPAP